ncbi:recombinase family protein [Aestuariibius sp. 2305UL40-4]|uniref:recombinase family protein n=1 Tax=Aestuariibius violaceus TaxID=3234132 RepID=UPI00345EA17B
MEDQRHIPKAVIYRRVSSSAQTKRGDGLTSQETRCREYARHKGYEVAQVFTDDMTGSLATRPGMQAMLTYLRKNRKRGTIVIIDDISRLARGLEAHLELRASLAKAGGKLESPSIEFGEDSDSILVENLLASVSQHQRQKNGEQTVNRMRARAMNGYWCFQAPVGYRYQRISGRGNMLVRDEPTASLLREALEGYACGRFQTKVEVKRFLESQPAFPKDTANGLLHHQRIQDILTRPIYAGYLDVPLWNVPLRKAQHEGLIDFETFQKIQNRLQERAKAPARKDISADFPLRNFILCNDCQKPLTSCWSKSKTGKKHPYYLCHTKGCPSYRKSIRRDELEGAFADMLQTMQPTDGLFALVRQMFKDAWDQQLARVQSQSGEAKRQIKAIEKQVDGLMDRIVEANSSSVISAYEAKIDRLETEKLLLTEKLRKTGQPKRSFEEMFELAMAFLASPWKLWASGNLPLQRTVLKLAFAERLAYCRKEGLRTPKTTLPFKALEAFSTGEREMARWGGFEPPTP